MLMLIGCGNGIETPPFFCAKQRKKRNKIVKCCQCWRMTEIAEPSGYASSAFLTSVSGIFLQRSVELVPPSLESGLNHEKDF